MFLCHLWLRHGQALPLDLEAPGPLSHPYSAAGLLSISRTRYLCGNADNSEPDFIRTCNKLCQPTHHVQSPGFPAWRGITAHRQPGVLGGINQPASSQGSEPPLNRSPRGPEILAQVALALSLTHRALLSYPPAAREATWNSTWPFKPTFLQPSPSRFSQGPGEKARVSASSTVGQPLLTMGKL